MEYAHIQFKSFYLSTLDVTHKIKLNYQALPDFTASDEKLDGGLGTRLGLYTVLDHKRGREGHIHVHMYMYQ